MRRALLVVSCVIGLATAADPSPAAAQSREAFAGAVLDLTRALHGAHGDEGPHVAAALESMSRALTAWDRDIERFEAALASIDADTAPAVAARMWTTRGQVYLGRGRVADAVEAFDRAITIDSANATPYLLRALARAAREPARARPDFRKAWELDPGDPIKAYWLVRSAHGGGAREDVLRAVNTLSAAYREIIEQGRTERAQPFSHAALFRDDAAGVPLFPPVAYQAGYALLLQGEYGEAIAALHDAAAADPLVVDEVLRSDAIRDGIAALKQGRAAQALAHLERTVDTAPRSSEARRVLGIAYRAAGRLEESIAQLEASIEADPRNERAHLELISVLEDAGDPMPVQRALRAALETLPTSGSLRWLSAVLHRRLDNEDEMLRQLQAVPAAGMLMGRGQVLAAIGRLHLAGMRAAAAERPFREAVLVAPNNPAAHMDLGELYRTEGATAPALASFVAALLIAPDIVGAHTAIGQIYLADDRVDEAAVAFGRAVALHSEHPDAQYGLASALLRLGRAAEAKVHLETFRRLAARRAADLHARYELSTLKREAALREDEGRPGEAAAIWETILEREPGVAGNHRAFGEALVSAGRIDAGIQQLERAAALDPAPDVYRRLAELYAEAGDARASARVRAEYERRLADAFRQRSGLD